MAQEQDSLLEDVNVVLTSGGKGTRSEPVNLYATGKMIPKGLLRVKGVPVARLQILQLVAEGIKNFYIITKYLENRDMLSNRFGDGNRQFNANIKYSSPLEDILNNGSGDAILRNSHERNLDGHSIVLANDNIYEAHWKDVVGFHKKNNALITIMAALVDSRDTIGNYGLLLVDNGRVKEIIEKPKSEYKLKEALGVGDLSLLSEKKVWVNTAGYILNNEALREVEGQEWVRRGRGGGSGEFDMAGNLIAGCVKRGLPIYATLIDDWGDLGTRSKYLELSEEALGHRFPSIDTVLSRRGYVTIGRNVWVHPETYEPTDGGVRGLKQLIEAGDVEIGPNAFIGRDVKIGKGAKIRYSSVEKNSTVGEGASISHSIIFPYCIIGDYAEVDRSILGLQVMVNSSRKNPTIIGEHSYLGPEIKVPEGCHLIETTVYPAYEFGKGTAVKGKTLKPKIESLIPYIRDHIDSLSLERFLRS